MTIRSLLDQLHDELLLSFSHVNEPQIDPDDPTKVLRVTTKESEWAREATLADVATIATRVQHLGAALFEKAS